jgi:hypothetical protein
LEEHADGSLTGYFEIFFFYLHIWVLLSDPENIANLSSGTEEETSVHMLCEFEALASLRHVYLGSFLMDSKDVTNLSMGAI